MAIEFHCDHCGHKVRAPDDAAGKHGKCPSCKNSIYIPTPSEDLEPLTFAPRDDHDAAERRRADEESRQLANRLRGERNEPPPDAPGKTKLPDPVGDARLPSDIETLIFEYLICMKDGKLGEAEALADEIRAGDKSRAKEIVARLTMDELPPTRIAHIPRALLTGFLKQLKV